MAAAKSRWVLSIAAVVLLLFFTVLLVHIYRPEWFQIPVSGVSPEEYRVFSGFLNDFVQQQQQNGNHQKATKLRVVNETFLRRDPGNMLPLDVVSLGSEQMGRDFYRKNRKRFPLQSEFETRLLVELVSNSYAEKASWGGFGSSTPNDPYTPGIFSLSRPGFNGEKSAAILYYWLRCGGICGQSGWVLLRKVNDTWHIEKFGMSVIR